MPLYLWHNNIFVNYNLFSDLINTFSGFLSYWFSVLWRYFFSFIVHCLLIANLDLHSSYSITGEWHSEHFHSIGTDAFIQCGGQASPGQKILHEVICSLCLYFFNWIGSSHVFIRSCFIISFLSFMLNLIPCTLIIHLTKFCFTQWILGFLEISRSSFSHYFQTQH